MDVADAFEIQAPFAQAVLAKFLQQFGIKTLSHAEIKRQILFAW